MPKVIWLFLILVLPAAAIAAMATYPLWAFNRAVPKDAASRRIASEVPYGSDPRQRLDVYAPAEDSNTPRPVVVFFYGGSWNSGRRQDYAFVGRALAAAGYVVVIPDYRLVPQVVFPTFVQDGAAAVRWARRQAGRFGGDGETIVLVGHSAGAYIAAMLALDHRFLGDDREPVRGLATRAGPFDFLPMTNPAAIAAMAGWPDQPDTQPINHVGAGAPPALLLHGADDETVEPRNSLVLKDKLSQAGVPVEVKLYPGIAHVGIMTAMALPLRGRAPVLQDLTAWIGATTAAARGTRRIATERGE